MSGLRDFIVNKVIGRGEEHYEVRKILKRSLHNIACEIASPSNSIQIVSEYRSLLNTLEMSQLKPLC